MIPFDESVQSVVSLLLEMATPITVGVANLQVFFFFFAEQILRYQAKMLQTKWE